MFKGLRLRFGTAFVFCLTASKTASKTVGNYMGLVLGGLFFRVKVAVLPYRFRALVYEAIRGQKP